MSLSAEERKQLTALYGEPVKRGFVTLLAYHLTSAVIGVAGATQSLVEKDSSAALKLMVKVADNLDEIIKVLQLPEDEVLDAALTLEEHNRDRRS